MKLNLGAGPCELDGFINLDAAEGWHFEDGLAGYADGSVEAITESHALMYVALEDWPFVFAEFARVLEPDGIIRITEDDTENPESERFGGWHDSVTLTSPDLVRKYLKSAGLRTRLQEAGSSGFRDLSLCQAYHGEEPKVFFIEGKKT